MQSRVDRQIRALALAQQCAAHVEHAGTFAEYNKAQDQRKKMLESDDEGELPRGGLIEASVEEQHRDSRQQHHRPKNCHRLAISEHRLHGSGKTTHTAETQQQQPTQPHCDEVQKQRAAIRTKRRQSLFCKKWE